MAGARHLYDNFRNADLNEVAGATADLSIPVV
jgi:hypothetical protein